MKRLVRKKFGQLALLVCVTESAVAVGIGQCRDRLPGETSPPVPTQAVRAIDDYALGIHWLLVADREHSGAPGRLVALSGRNSDGRRDFAAPPAPRIVRGGDPVLVEQDSATMRARLEAIALGPAAAGEILSVRLTTTGKALRVRAVAPGRAELCETRP